MKRALDLFCGAGGATRGLQLAGYHVTGIDLRPQPNYCGDLFIQMNALDVAKKLAVRHFDLVWASPPCQRYMTGGVVHRERAPDLIGSVRELLQRKARAWIIENVPGAPLRPDIILCGTMFGLPLRRHRVFELSFDPPKAKPHDHSRPIVGVYGHPHGRAGAWPGMLPSTLATWRRAMGIDWMTARELSQAIPPAYSKFLTRHVDSRRLSSLE